MNRRRNKGISKPALLMGILAVSASVGVGTYAVMKAQKSQENESGFENIDPTSPVSIAGALYGCILSDSFDEMPSLISMLKTYEAENPDASGEPEDQNDIYAEDNNTEFGGDDMFRPAEMVQDTGVDISKYLSNAANQNIRDKVIYLSEQLDSSKLSPETYSFYLNSLSNIFEVYKPKTEEERVLRDSVVAYTVFKNNPDYTINDIRAIFGPYDALNVSRFLIGSGDYERISGYELRRFITDESKSLIALLPTNLNRSVQLNLSASDFVGYNTDSLRDVIRLKDNLPVVMAHIPMIREEAPKENHESIESLKSVFESSVRDSLEFAEMGKKYYECVATTSEPFFLTGVVTPVRYKNVASLEKIPLHTYKMNVTRELPGCPDLKSIFILAPDLKAYSDLLSRGAKKMSDEDRNNYHKDISLLERINNSSGDEITLTLLGSDIAAVENHLEQNPEQGKFVGNTDQGILYNLNLPSMKLLKTLEISPDIKPIFMPAKLLTTKRVQAINKLKIIADFRSVEEKLSGINFGMIEYEPYKFISQLRNGTTGSDTMYTADTAETKKPLSDDTSAKPVSPETETAAQTAVTVSADTAPVTPDVLDDEIEPDTAVTAKTENDTVPEKDETQVPAEAKPHDTAMTETKEEEPPHVIMETADVKTPEPGSAEDLSNNTISSAAASSDEKPSESVQLTDIPAEDENLITPEMLQEKDIATLKVLIDEKNADAMYELADRYLNGHNGVRKNTAKGLALLEDACNNDNRNAQYVYGQLLLNDAKSSASQKSHGAELIIKAAESGHPDAMYLAGVLLYKGEYGIVRNLNKAFEYFSMASEQNNQKATYMMAKMYLNGEGVKKNKQRGFNLLIHTARNNPDAAFDLATIFEGGVIDGVKDERHAAENFVYAARKGNRNAYRKAGLYLIGTKTGTKEALRYLEQYRNRNDKEVDSALLNYYIATNNQREIAGLIAVAPAEIQEKYPVEMGMLYENGNGVAQDYAKAEEYYRKGTDLKIADAFCHLGDLFNNGLGRTRDLRAAVGQYTRGADMGSVSCKEKLAVIKATETNYRNYGEAHSLIDGIPEMKRSDTGKAVLAAMYLYGKGAQKSPSEALKLLRTMKTGGASVVRSVYESGNSKGSLCTNPILAGGIGVKNRNSIQLSIGLLSDLFFIKDYADNSGTLNFSEILSKAKKICKHPAISIMFDATEPGRKPASANPTDPEAQYRLAMHLFREGNYEESFKWLKQSADQEHVKALNNLGIYYLFGIGTTQNNQKAHDTIIKAVSRGNPKAHFNLAALKMYGIGCNADTKKAVEILHTAAKMGDRGASVQLTYNYLNGVWASDNEDEAFVELLNILTDK